MTTLTPLVQIPAGKFRMGSEGFYPEEGPVREVDVARFRMEQHPVTNAQFAKFVEETGYATVAEVPPDPADFPGADPNLLVAGGLVFTPTQGPVSLDRWDKWWRWVPGASWRSPGGPGTSIEGRERHPVVLVSYEDAAAYARWAGRSLPTEKEFEYAARGGLPETTYAWGEDAQPNGELMANTWQGPFPYRNLGSRGWFGTSPVGTFPPNPLGLLDMIGNVWEWTTTYYATGSKRTNADELSESTASAAASCCAPNSAELRLGVPEAELARASASPGEFQPRRVLKGGSHLCAPEYCLRYRPPARTAQSVDSATTHLGFRCVVRGEQQ